MARQRLALTMGDPAGIGPEIVLKAIAALARRDGDAVPKCRVVGARGVMAAAARALDLPVRLVGEEGSSYPSVQLVELPEPEAPVPLGRDTAEGGELAYRAVARAVELALAGEVDGIVTAPLSKAALNLAGHPFPGHTELLAALTGSRDTVLMLAHGAFRVTHVTTHVALERVPGLITAERLRRVIDLTLLALRRLGIERPRLAVAALNPHAGEGGLFGREDIDRRRLSSPPTRHGARRCGPGARATRSSSISAPAHYDAVVAMYHDQGHIPVKLLGFNVDPATGKWQALSGVNVTLGLPIIRTSVDHGTAFDIAGKGVADATSMVEAIDYADRLAAAGKGT